MVRSTLLWCVSRWARRAKFQFQRKVGFRKYLSPICQSYRKILQKLISPATSWVFEAPDSCTQWHKMSRNGSQTIRFWPTCDQKWRKSEMLKNLQKSFLRMFCVLFLCKWCAALSSAVSLGGPEGQKFRFNAKLVFENISAQYVNHIQRFCKNEFL